MAVAGGPSPTRGPSSCKATLAPHTRNQEPEALTQMSQALDVTDTTWDETVIKSDTPVLVDFWAEWCGPCKAMGPSVDKLAEEMGAELRVVKLDTENNADTAAKYGVMSIPTFLLIKNGEVVHTMMGAKPYDAFKAEVVGAL